MKTKYSAHHTPPYTQEPPDLLTTKEVARILRCDDTTVRRWIKQGTFAAVNLPRPGKSAAYRVKRATLDALLHPTH